MTDQTPTGHTLTDAERHQAHEARMDKYGSSLTPDNVQRVIDRIADYPEIVAAALAARGGNTDNGLRAAAWDQGWKAAQQVVELDGVKCWAHTVFPEGYEGNPYRHGDAAPAPTEDRERDECWCADPVFGHTNLTCPSRPAPTDNQHDNGLADRVRALADDFNKRADEASRRELSDRNAYARRVVWDRAAALLRAVVDGPTTPE